MKIAVRMDDISPNMNWEKFNTFYELLRNKNIFPLLGVVPCNRDQNLNVCGHTMEDAEFFGKVRQMQEDGCTIAMHGCYHVYDTKKGGRFPLNHFSEFAGHSYEEQVKRLEKGRQILSGHGIDTDFFMAPGHSYDGNTLKALRESGFTRITDGFGRKPYLDKGMIFYPISFKQSISLKRKKGITAFVVHSNMMSEKDFAYWKEILARPDIEWISYKEYIHAAADRRHICGRGMEWIMATLKHILAGI